MPIKPISPEQDYHKRIMRRFKINFVIIRDSVAEEGENGPDPGMANTNPECQMWQLLIPSEIRQRIDGLRYGSRVVPEDAIFEEVWEAIVHHGPVVYLNPDDYGVVRSKPGLEADGVITFLRGSDCVATTDNTEVYLSEKIPKGYFLRLSAPDSRLSDESPVKIDIFDFQIQPLLAPQTLWPRNGCPIGCNRQN